MEILRINETQEMTKFAGKHRYHVYIRKLQLIAKWCYCFQQFHDAIGKYNVFLYLTFDVPSVHTSFMHI